MKKKRSLTLIEVMICLTLFTFLASSLFFWYRNLTAHKDQLHQVKWEVQEQRYAYQRLERIFSSIKAPVFTSFADNSLVFRFDRGPFLDPDLSGTVLAKLYHDQENNTLCLGVWPNPEHQETTKRFPSQSLVLLENVAQLKFEFYSPPDPFKKPVDPNEVGKPNPHDGWQESWNADYRAVPALIKLEITTKHPIEYIFDLSIPIIYPKEMTST